MLKIRAMWKKNMFWFNMLEWMGVRQPPHCEPLMTLLEGDEGRPKSSRTEGCLDIQTRQQLQ